MINNSSYDKNVKVIFINILLYLFLNCTQINYRKIPSFRQLKPISPNEGINERRFTLQKPYTAGIRRAELKI